MRVVVTGSRDFKDALIVCAVLQGLYEEHKVGWRVTHVDPFIVVEGQCPYGGADWFAEWWATESPLHHYRDESKDAWSQPCWVEHEPFPADWEELGRKAGPIRNHEMMKSEPKANLCAAFVNKPLRDSKGTAGAVGFARQYEIPYLVVESHLDTDWGTTPPRAPPGGWSPAHT